MSFIVAQRRPELVRGIVGIAADPDFTEELLWKKLPEEIKAKIMNDGIYNVKWGSETYPISKKLIEDGRNNLLLSGGPGICTSYILTLELHYLNPSTRLQPTHEQRTNCSLPTHHVHMKVNVLTLVVLIDMQSSYIQVP